jgi:capsular exopolysaccharide synthesis family protein
VVVTGPQAGAGATTVAANLGLAMAEAGRKAILVDGNLADPGLSRLFGLGDTVGLREVLAGDAELAAALSPAVESGLLVLPAGRSTAGSGSVLAGPLMVGLLERLEAQADVVIIDAPPVLPYAAAAELAAIADAALIVARFGRTKVEEVQQARVTLSQVGTPVLGVVVNAVPGRDPAAVIGVARTQGPAEAASAGSAELLERTAR